MAVTYLFRFKTFRIDRSAFRMKAKTCTTVLSLGVSSFITQFAITIVMALTNNLLVSYGALSIYGSEIPMTATGIVMKVNQILISILVGIAVGAQPIIGFNYGAKDFTRVKKALDIALVASEIIAIIAFLIFQFAPMSVVSLFGSEEGLYNEFAVKAFRIFLMLCPLTGFQTVVAGGGQAPQVTDLIPGPSDYFLCTCCRSAAEVPGRGRCALDRACGRWSGLPAVGWIADL